jgi:hypothetical protein
MTLKKIIINGNTYNYYNPDSYNDFKLYQRQVKRVREKCRACKNGGCYDGKVTKTGLPYYSNYEELLSFLEGLLKEKQE